MNKYFAVKCNYNNGDEGDLVGFNGVCSNDIIMRNIKKYTWCMQLECACNAFYKKGFSGQHPKDPCLESRLFREWEFGAGHYHNGERKGQPKEARIEEGGIALLTTRFPDDDIEENRRIIGFFKVTSLTNDIDEGTKFYADKSCRVRLPLEEARQLYFWEYYSVNSNSPKWGSGLIRYLTKEQTACVLYDLKDTIQGQEGQEIIQKLLTNEFKDIRHPTPQGMRRRLKSRTKTILAKRKYGPGGEGQEHKKLKNWIAKNPKKIGITNAKSSEIEHVYVSGDMVDILFKLSDGTDVVVEIETNIPLPGCHQALKYRALRCAERGIKLSSQNVKAAVVAFQIDKDTEKFCNFYGIDYFRFKPEEVV